MLSFGAMALLWAPALLPHAGTVLAQTQLPDGIFQNPAAANLYQDVTRIENQLYGHPYLDESMARRIQRLEKTLFGVPQTGTLESRFLAVASKVKQDKVVQSASTHERTHERTIDYLEQRFFQHTNESMPMAERLSLLESYIFGKTFEKYPAEERMKKLSYTVPLSTREIRLSREGKLIATTNVRKKKPALPEESDYFDAVYKLPNAKVLRWMHLPARVYVQQGSPAERQVVLDAVTQWNTVFPIRVTESLQEADILIDWAPPTRPVTSLTLPSIRMSDPSTVRTVMTINMSPFLTHPKETKLRAMLHQLGHASGIWGHSDQPEDVMYPSNRLEARDIPEKWNQGVLKFSSEAPEPLVGTIPVKPSNRDRKTLTQIYSTPGQDIRLYAP